MQRGHLAVIALFTAAVWAGACAHEARRPPADPYVAKGVAAIDAWFEQLSGCAPAAALKPAVYAPDATFVEVHGSLTLTATPACTLNRCEGECCNSCAPAWVVIPDGSAGPPREFALVKSGQSSPMSASVKDCKLRAVREQIRKPRVIVSGWLESDPVQPKIIRASICVVKPPPAAISHGNGFYEIIETLSTPANEPILLNASTQSFSERGFGDYDADGCTDFLFYGGNTKSIYTVRSLCDGTFTTLRSTPPNFVDWAIGSWHFYGDYNGDGRTDILLTGRGGWGTIPVAFSNGDGTYRITNSPVANFPQWSTAAWTRWDGKVRLP